MKKFSVMQTAAMFSGCFLGAGYLSGQELWQFFGSFGKFGMAGLALAAVAFFIFGTILLRLIQDCETSEFEKVIVRKDIKVLRNIFSFAEIFLLLSFFVIMSAGAGALANQVFNISFSCGAAVFCAIVSVFALFGFMGAVSAFSVTVPLIVLFTAVISIVLAFKNGIGKMPALCVSGKSGFANNFIISALSFVMYNLFASVGILSSAGKYIKERKQVYLGVFAGCAFMFIPAIGILASIANTDGAAGAQLPMLYAISQLSRKLGCFFAILLFLGMFGTALSSVVSITQYFEAKKNINKYKKGALVFATGIFAFICGFFGFSRLVSVVYPVFGYVGAAAFLFIIEHFIYIKRHGAGRLK